jgi:divalent metal cation (Fe/Co/Zn/Cd) transporter
MGNRLPWDRADRAAPVVIGIILAGAAITLAIETKSLLIGEAASPETVAAIKAIVEATRRSLRSTRCAPCTAARRTSCWRSP